MLSQVIHFPVAILPTMVSMQLAGQPHCQVQLYWKLWQAVGQSDPVVPGPAPGRLLAGQHGRGAAPEPKVYPFRTLMAVLLPHGGW